MVQRLLRLQGPRQNPSFFFFFFGVTDAYRCSVNRLGLERVRMLRFFSKADTPGSPPASSRSGHFSRPELLLPPPGHCPPHPQPHSSVTLDSSGLFLTFSIRGNRACSPPLFVSGYFQDLSASKVPADFPLQRSVALGDYSTVPRSSVDAELGYLPCLLGIVLVLRDVCT